MLLDAKKYLKDILDAISGIESYLGDSRDFNIYMNNRMLRKAVEREFEVIGEAMKRLLVVDPKIEITNARKIVDFRNWVIHGYDNVDHIIVWAIIVKDLPILKSEVEALLIK